MNGSTVVLAFHHQAICSHIGYNDISYSLLVYVLVVNILLTHRSICHARVHLYTQLLKSKCVPVINVCVSECCKTSLVHAHYGHQDALVIPARVPLDHGVQGFLVLLQEGLFDV